MTQRREDRSILIRNIKQMIEDHANSDHEQFYKTSYQAADFFARTGDKEVASELKDLIRKKSVSHTRLHIKDPTGMRVPKTNYWWKDFPVRQQFEFGTVFKKITYDLSIEQVRAYVKKLSRILEGEKDDAEG